MAKEYYIAACVFTARFPALSERIQRYVHTRFQMPIVRCCTPKFMVKDFEDQMPEEFRDSWCALPQSVPFAPGDTVYSICHNCLNIIEETCPGVQVRSIWELILSDPKFVFPDYHGLPATIQDCWRSRDRSDEQAAVRTLLDRMNINWQELPQNHGDTDFCGNSLYKPQPPRNPALAPLHYKENAVGKFLPHSEQEQTAIMKDYCTRFQTDAVVCYCHYCLEGLLMGQKNAKHLAQLLFDHADL